MASAFQFKNNSSRLFGRGEDFQQLTDRVKMKRGLTAVMGPPRIGKTWLLREFSRRICGDNNSLVGYAHSNGEGDLLKSAVTDLYLRWFSDSSFTEQAKAAWKSNKDGKDGFFARFTASTVNMLSDIVESIPVAGPVAKPLLAGGKNLFSALADADANLRGQKLIQDLTYEQSFEIVTMLAEVAGRKIVLVLDAFDQIPDTQRQFGVLRGFLTDIESWPEIHVFVAIKQNKKGEPANEFRSLCDMYPPAEVVPLGGMNLEGDEETKLAQYIRTEVPALRDSKDAKIIELLEGYPAVVEQLIYRSDAIETMDDVLQEVENAKSNRYPEFDRFRDMTPDEQKLGLRLAICKQLSDLQEWNLLEPILTEGLGEGTFAKLQTEHLLKPIEYPTFGHQTRHQAALDWFIANLPAILSDQVDHVIRMLGAKVQDVDDHSLPFILALVALRKSVGGLTISTQSEAIVNCAFVLTELSIEDQSSYKMLSRADWKAAAAWGECAALLSMGLFNTLYYAKAEGDLPRRDALLDELRDLRVGFPDDALVRERLAKGLFNTLIDAEDEGDQSRCDAILQELRELQNAFPDDAPVREAMAMGLFNTLNHAKDEGDQPRCDALMEELRDLRKAFPDDAPVREQLAKGLYNTLNDAKEEDDLSRRDALLDELRDLREAFPDDAPVRERLAKGLFNTLNHAKDEGDLPRRDALLQELRDLKDNFPDDAPVRERLAAGLYNTLNDAKAGGNLPRRDALLQELRDLREAFADDAPVREALAKGLYNTLHHAKAEGDLPRRDALLQELRDLSEAYADDASVRERVAKGLYNTLHHAKAGEDLARRDALLQELRDLREAFPDDAIWQKFDLDAL